MGVVWDHLEPGMMIDMVLGQAQGPNERSGMKLAARLVN